MINAALFNRLLSIADIKAKQAFTTKGLNRAGPAAMAANLDLEALQYAIAIIKDESRVQGFDGPVDLKPRR